jgi:ketosteroid isomerase-like protein
MRKHLNLIFILLVFFIGANAQKSFIRDSTDVVNRAKDFISAFNNFKWEKFRNFFADDATMFHPQPENARLIGRKEVEATWLKIFPEFIDTANKKVMDITPKEILVQLYNETAIITFHLQGNTSLGRRSIVWVKQKGVWKIVHLHASTLPVNN